MHARRRPGHLVHVLAVLLLALVAAACSPSTDQPAGPATPPPGPEITVSPADGASAVNPLDPVSVSTIGGTLESVTMTNDEGRVVEGIFTPDRLSWKPGVPLGYGRTYTLAVAAVGDQGVRSEKTSTFSTVTPGNQTMPSFVTTGGNLLADGGTFGIGAVIV
ncbi:Ig-like domain-containing protein, partial [Rhodococcus sp. NPDC059968]|uniref:Ig-like domain-containing protein n=1 Tax=Rhodococcus sp. NPDC059968 TaxID=3347017 RepID=UPI00366EB560